MHAETCVSKASPMEDQVTVQVFTYQLVILNQAESLMLVGMPTIKEMTNKCIEQNAITKLQSVWKFSDTFLQIKCNLSYCDDL